MKSCTACEGHSTCENLCDQAAAAIRPAWSTSLRELCLGAVIDVVASSQAHIEVNSELPYFDELKPMENKMLHYFYCQGLTYAEIAQRTRKGKNTVKATLSRAKKKIVPIYSKVRRTNDG